LEAFPLDPSVLALWVLRGPAPVQFGERFYPPTPNPTIPHPLLPRQNRPPSPSFDRPASLKRTESLPLSSFCNGTLTNLGPLQVKPNKEAWVFLCIERTVLISPFSLPPSFCCFLSPSLFRTRVYLKTVLYDIQAFSLMGCSRVSLIFLRTNIRQAFFHFCEFQERLLLWKRLRVLLILFLIDVRRLQCPEL